MDNLKASSLSGEKSSDIKAKESEKTERWCRLILWVCYAAIGINLAVLIATWYFFVFIVYEASHLDYWLRYIIGPSAVMLLVTLFVHYLIEKGRLSSAAKQYATLLLVLFFCLFLCFVHGIVSVLLATFVFPIFLSTIFADLKLSRNIFILSLFGLLLSGMKMHLFSARPFGHWIFIEMFTALGLLTACYMLSKIMIKSGQDYLSSLQAFSIDRHHLKEQLKLDPFTGLYNRKTFDELLPQIIEECKASDDCLSLAVLDLDGFKKVNDKYGHVAGDAVIQRLANILIGNKTKNIFAFRIGGEEFALLLKDYCVNDAYKICEGMRSIMESSSVPEVDYNKVTYSCGLACMDKVYSDGQSLYRAADEALYKAKNSGKNRTMIYETVMTA